MFMRRVVVTAVSALALGAETSIAQKLYRHVDENGKVTFSDRPQKADQKAEKMKKPNVASREATRQVQIGAQESSREEAAERAAAQRRAAGVQQKERAEKQRQRQLDEEQHPERAPRTIRVVP
jgi:hypothetical protein